MDHIDIKHVVKLIERARELPEDALKLPAPKRATLEITKDYLESFLGSVKYTIDDLITQGMPSGEIYRYCFLTEECRNWLQEANVSRESFETMVQARRFQLSSAPVLTYRTSLCQKLDDMEVGSKVPMALLKPPYNNCYIEFGPSEEREQSKYTIFSAGEYFTLEGAYISFFQNVNKNIISSNGYEKLSIHKESPMRCFEISFTASPLSMKGNNRTVFADLGTYISFYWTDDNQTIEETLNKHFSLMEDNKNIPDKMIRSIKDNMLRLTKALLYLMSGNRYQEKEKIESDLSRRLRALKNPAKARKLTRQLYRRYDRIVVGPNKPYVPLSERLDSVYARTGVKPHIRRAHWSSRWSGPKKAVLKPVQIDATLVNAQGLSDDDVSLLQKDYDIK